MLNSLVLIGGGTTVSPTRTGSHDIGILKGPTGYVEIRNAQPFSTSIDGNSDKNGDTKPIFSKLIGRELFHHSRANIYLRCRLNFTRNAVGTKRPNFINLGLPALHTLDELWSFRIPTTRVRRPTDESNWSVPDHVFEEVTAAGMSGARSEQSYSYKTDFENRRKIRILGAKIFL